MPRAPRLLMFVGVAAAALGVAVAPALARPTRVALTQIAGDTSGLDQTVAGALVEGELEVVAGERVTRAIDRLGLTGALGERDLAKLADELEVDAVVKGAFDRRGRRLRFTVFAGGNQGKPFSVQVGDPGSDRFRQLVRATVEAKVAQAVPRRHSRPSEPDPDADDNPPVKRKGREVEVTEEDPPRKVRATVEAKVAQAVPKRHSRPSEPDPDADDDPPVKRKGKEVEVTEEDPPRKVRATVEAKVAQAVPKRHSRPSEPDPDADDDPPVKRKGREVEVAEEDPPRKRAIKNADEVADDEPPSRHNGKKAEVADAAEPSERTAEATDDRARHDKASRGGAAPAAARPRVAAREADDPAASARAQAEPAAPATEHIAQLAALRVDIGGSMAGRNLEFDTRSVAGSPKSYQNAPVPGVRVGGELYPIALFAPTSWLAGLGVAADYDQTLSLTLRAANEIMVPLATTELHYSFGVRYRLAFGHRPTSPTLTLGAGYGERRFVVDRRGLQSPTSLDLPDVDYQLFDPGVALRLPLGAHFAVALAGQVLLVTSSGGIERPDQYGTARVLGGSASAGIELVIHERLLIRLAAEATQLELSFSGNGMLSTGRDGDPSTVDVRGATDRYYGGVATAALTY